MPSSFPEEKKTPLATLPLEKNRYYYEKVLYLYFDHFEKGSELFVGFLGRTWTRMRFPVRDLGDASREGMDGVEVR